MKRVTLSYATLAFINAIKVEKSEIPDAYVLHNEKLADDIKKQHNGIETRR